jgi:hypothetical protein
MDIFSKNTAEKAPDILELHHACTFRSIDHLAQ